MWRRAVKIGISRGNDFVNSVPFIIEEKKYQSLLEHLLFLNFFSYYYSPFILCLFPWKKKIYFLSFPFVFSSSSSMCWAKSSSSRNAELYSRWWGDGTQGETDPARDSRWWLLLLLPPLVNVCGPLFLLPEKKKKKISSSSSFRFYSVSSLTCCAPSNMPHTQVYIYTHAPHT
jgi:hypothetical protein